MPFRPLVLALIALLAGCASAPPPAANPAAATATDAPGRTPAAAERSEKQAMAAIDTGNSVFFSRNSASLDDAGRAVLRQHAERLKANPKQQVTLASVQVSGVLEQRVVAACAAHLSRREFPSVGLSCR